ncbi:MAG TPA: glycosyltransferase family 4 protein [Steroidobacteraceae bacterium]
MSPVDVPTVMHLIDTGGPGGAETVFSQLASQLGRRGTRSLPIIPYEGWLSGQLRTLELQPQLLRAKGSLNIKYLRALVAAARANRVRLIHTHLLGSAVYGALVGLLTRTPVIAVIHGPTDLRSIGKLAAIKRWLLLHGCSALVAVSTSTREALMGFGVPAESILLIRNGVDTDEYSPPPAGEPRSGDLRAELALQPGELLVGAVGNIRAPKSYDVLLRAAALVAVQVPRCRFAIVGQGDESALQPLLALRNSLGLEQRCHFLGFRQSGPALYRNFDVFVSSSRSEGLSLAFLEAMASGLPVVATRSGGPQEVIEPEVSGVLVPIEDPAALAEGLRRTLVDVDFRSRLGIAGRERVVASFSLESVLREYARLYEKLLPKTR